MTQVLSDARETLLEPAVAQLRAAPEPVELRDRTRRLAESAPADCAAMIARGEWLADVLWTEWEGLLDPAGMDRESFVAIVRSYKRELWLWVMGERTWQQCVDGLAGRLVRRLPAIR